jgi:hypothetical protein
MTGYTDQSISVFRVTADYTVPTIMLTGTGGNTDGLDILNSDDPEEVKEYILSEYDKDPATWGDLFVSMGLPRNPHGWTSAQWEQAWMYYQQYYANSGEDAPSVWVSGSSSDSISLSWSPVSGASYYRIYRDGFYVGDVYGTDYTDTWLSPGTMYWYAVSAVSGANGVEGPQSPPVYLTTEGKSGGNTDGPPEGAKEYILSEYDKDPTTWGGFFVSIGLPSNPHGWTSAQWEQAWAYSGEGAPFVEVLASPSDSISLSWPPVSGASYYRVYRNGFYVEDVYGTSYADRVSPGTSYGYTVSAVSANGVEGPQSPPVYKL